MPSSTSPTSHTLSNIKLKANLARPQFAPPYNPPLGSGFNEVYHIAGFQVGSCSVFDGRRGSTHFLAKSCCCTPSVKPKNELELLQ